MTAETTLRIARNFSNVIAIKEASGNITQMDDIIKNKPDNFNVISGDDGITFPLITLGAVGVISVIGNAFPREFSRMTRLALQGILLMLLLFITGLLSYLIFCLWMEIRLE